MSETIINGIDVSECEKLGETIDGFTCGLGKRIRFANEIITKHNLCKDNPDCYFKQLKRLQEENKRLQMLSCANCGEKYLSPDGAELYEKNVQLKQELDIKEKMLDKFMIGSGETLEKLQKENEWLKKENEQLKKPCLVMPKVNQLAVPIEKYEKLYKALEEIREIAKYSVMHNSELNANYQIILQKIDEVLNDRN